MEQMIEKMIELSPVVGVLLYLLYQQNNRLNELWATVQKLIEDCKKTD